MNDLDATVFVVEDDPWVRRGLQKLLSSAGYSVETFSSAAGLLARKPDCDRGCLVLDLKLPGLSGLDLQRKLTAAGHTIPIIFLTAFGDIPATVQAIKGGAVDFLTKPVNKRALLDALQLALAQQNRTRQTQLELKSIRACIETLTPRERQVFLLVVAGRLNKQIAFELGITEKTVKVHRACVMEKMRVRSLADLVRAAGRVGVTPPK